MCQGGDASSSLTEGLAEQVIASKFDGLTPLQLSDLTYEQTAGGGGKGAVLLMRHVKYGQRIAVKVVRRSALCSDAARSNALRERQLLVGDNSLSHPLLAAGIACFKDAERLFLAMEFVPGGDLYSFMLERRALKPREVSFIVGSITLMLEYLHGRRIAYRDLKPENLMIGANGYVKLIDFGLCKKLGEAERTYTVCGTPIYMSPERFSARSGHGLESDWWSLGVLFFELTFSSLPFSMFGPPPDDDEVAEKICDPTFMPSLLDDVAGYPGVGPTTTSLMAQLMASDPAERADAAMVKSHEFFKGFDFDKLLRQELTPLVAPALNGAEDGPCDDAPLPPIARSSTLARIAARGDSADELLALDARPYHDVVPPGEWDELW